MVESLPGTMSGLRRFLSVGEETPTQEAYADLPSRAGLNPMLIMKSLGQIEEDQCDLWFLPVLEQRGYNEEEEFGVLECRKLHHSPVSVPSLPAPSEPMSETRDQPTLVEETPVPHYMVEDYLVPQYIVVEVSPMPMSGVKHRSFLSWNPPWVLRGTQQALNLRCL